MWSALSGSRPWRRVCAAATLVLLSAGGLLEPLEARGDSRAVDLDVRKDCGAYCLGVVLNLLKGEAPSFQKLRSLANVDEHGNSSLLDIARALRERGVDAQPYRPGQARPGQVCIFRIGSYGAGGNPSGHFVVAVPSAANSRHVVELSPPFSVRHGPWTSLSAAYGENALACTVTPAGLPTFARFAGFGIGLVLLGLGAFLLVARLRRGASRPHVYGAASVLVALALVGGCGAQQPSSAPSRAISFLPGDVVNLGSVQAGKRAVTIQVRNDGTEPITPRPPQSSCGCLSVDFDTSPLQPGEVRSCEALLSIRRFGAQSHSITFLFEGIGIRVVRIHASGVATGLRYRGERDLGRVFVNSTTKFQLDIGIDESWLRGRDRPSRPEVTWQLVEGGSVRLGETTLTPELERGGLVARAALTVRPAFVGRGLCRVHAFVDGVAIPFHVHWSASSPLHFSESALVLRTEGDDRLRGQVRVSTTEEFALLGATLHGEKSPLRVRLDIEPKGVGATLAADGPVSWASSGIGTIDVRVLRRATGEEMVFPLRVVAAFKEAR